MPYTFRIIDDGTGVIRTGSGVVTADEIITSAHETRSNPGRARKLTHALVDFSTITELRISNHEMHSVVHATTAVAKLTPGAVVALVAPASHAFGIARMWETLMDEAGWITGVFRERPEAETWMREQLAGLQGEAAPSA